MSILRTQVPRALKPLLSPARYKGAYGGRGAAKSHYFAEQALVRCYLAPARVVCIREVQRSIADSVRQLLVDKIAKLGLGAFFEVLEAEIRGSNGSLIIFRGMQSYNAENIKSLEGYDIAWVEEAQTLSEHSLNMLRPTIRKPGSELWFSWNPRLRTDAVDLFFRKNRDPDDPDIVVVEVNWRDNPWFPDVLRKDMERDLERDPELAAHIWEGAYGLEQGAILARLVDQAEKAGRIHDGVTYDPNGPGVEISADLGFRNAAGWWFWQRRIGGYALLDVDIDSNVHADQWILRLQERLNRNRWKLGRIWLPHDANNQSWQTRRTGLELFMEHFGADMVRVIPKTSVLDRISAGAKVIKRCEFHKTRCEKGLDALRGWHYAYDEERKIFSREPEHDANSDGADAFTYGCQVMEEQAPPAPVAPEPPPGLAAVNIPMLKEHVRKQERRI